MSKVSDERTPLKEETKFINNHFLIKKHIEISFFILCALTILSIFNFPFALLFTTLSHQVPDSDLFTKGNNDVFRICFWFLLFILGRTFFTTKVLLPIGVSYGIPRYSTLMSKFLQQGLYAVYYTMSWSIGMYLLKESPYGFDFRQLWASYPYIEFTRNFKEYYLAQFGFWISEFYFVHVEPRRKDHLNMLVHHLITISLIFTSYLGNFTPFGHVILVMMDLPDVLLSSAKVMNYIKFQTLTDTLFGLFTIVWLFLRHFAFIYLLYVIAYDPLNLRIPMEWSPEKGIYLTWPMLSMFLALLSGLQVLMVIWFFMICKVIAKVISGAKAEDIRSDDED